MSHEEGYVDMSIVNKINVYLRDKCNVPMSDSFRLAMVIVQNKEHIFDILGGKRNEDTKL